MRQRMRRSGGNCAVRGRLSDCQVCGAAVRRRRPRWRQQQDQHRGKPRIHSHCLCQDMTASITAHECQSPHCSASTCARAGLLLLPLLLPLHQPLCQRHRPLPAAHIRQELGVCLRRLQHPASSKQHPASSKQHIHVRCPHLKVSAAASCQCPECRAGVRLRSPSSHAPLCTHLDCSQQAALISIAKQILGFCRGSFRCRPLLLLLRWGWG